MAKTWRKMGALLLALSMMFGLLAVGASAEGESDPNLTEAAQMNPISEARFSYNEETGEFVTDEDGDYCGCPIDGHTFVAIKQATWSLVWTADALTAEQQETLKNAICNSDVQLSPGDGIFYFFSGFGTETTVNEQNGGTYYVREVEGIHYLIAHQEKRSHFYYGTYNFNATPPVTGSETGSLTISKTVTGLPAEAGNQTYTFAISGPAEADGTYDSVTFTDGSATVDITGAGSVTITDLPAGEYTVSENPAGNVTVGEDT